jgi:hypothetical protein
MDTFLETPVRIWQARFQMGPPGLEPGTNRL